ncbi:hypothetical protein ABEG18_12895 [Alsobacter sp. KACC 23698]|uniref:Uncharacterized protein n=1 Tax=Alsobacter sp. KACC 23698 TaxID=3149229 RepID=A0AAU7JMG5_9HYPH
MPAGFRVCDAQGTWLAYCYGDSTGYRSTGSVMMSPDQAMTMAELIARLPDLEHGFATAELPNGLQGPLLVQDRTTWFAVTDPGGILIAAVYHSDPQAGDLNRDEARRIAGGIARLPWLPSSGPARLAKM